MAIRPRLHAWPSQLRTGSSLVIIVIAPRTVFIVVIIVVIFLAVILLLAEIVLRHAKGSSTQCCGSLEGWLEQPWRGGWGGISLCPHLLIIFFEFLSETLEKHQLHFGHPGRLHSTGRAHQRSANLESGWWEWEWAMMD